MNGLLAASRVIDRVSGTIGRSVAWLIVAAAVISAANAVVRKTFDWSANSLLEIQWWLFAAVFLLASPWTLAANEHIRIDVVSSRLSTRTRNLIELMGHVFFLLPTAAMIVYTSWIFFATSFAQNEQSPNAGGLPLWPIKALIPIAFALLFVQGLSELIKRIAIMRGDMAATPPHDGYRDLAVAMDADLNKQVRDAPDNPAGDQK
ncbi:TRAP transporter small permease subunit [Hyphomicrobium sp.]|uniref:TRAP transporter small permease subunit n=1 Tax=Hyphomicrobium sp. TaxID=82 RepID=UPI002E376659|nr:TRAP transporter small permease subunit [Hyphomicrobium sp.]HEX2839853.1 TRAP transporter small permease subunit [Hyphomicrobium sp.]